jgi:hypothetical protein
MLFLRFDSSIASNRISSDQMSFEHHAHGASIILLLLLRWLIFWTNFFLPYPSAEGLFDHSIVHPLSQMQHFKTTLLTKEELSWQKKVVLAWSQETLCSKTIMPIRYVVALTYFRRIRKCNSVLWFFHLTLAGSVTCCHAFSPEELYTLEKAQQILST